MLSHVLYVADVFEGLSRLPDESVDCVVTSPPYWRQRRYDCPGEIGQEPTVHEYVETLVRVFREVRRVLKSTGTVWLNIGDGYMGSGGAGGDYNLGGRRYGQAKFGPKRDPKIPNKSLALVPHRLAIALVDDGWICRNDVIWHKKASSPGSARDRLRTAHEHVFFLARGQRNWFDSFFSTAGDVWKIRPVSRKSGHPAAFPGDLVGNCILAGCPEGGTVLDPFGGSGTVSVVAHKLGRNSIYIDAKQEYAEMARQRLLDSGVDRQDITLVSLQEIIRVSEELGLYDGPNLGGEPFREVR